VGEKERASEREGERESVGEREGGREGERKVRVNIYRERTTSESARKI